MDIHATVARFDEHLRTIGTAERAAGAKAYLKSDFEFRGITAPQLRAMVRTFYSEHRALDVETLRSLVDALWETPVAELRLLGVALLERYADSLTPEDLSRVEGFLRRSHTWALVDFLSTKVSGAIVARFPQSRTTLRRWALDADFWVRRAALLSLLDDVRHGGDFGFFTELATPMLGEREFFIRKAIGWVLREVSKKRPDVVRAYVDRHGAQMSGLTRREATKYLPARARPQAAASE